MSGFELEKGTWSDADFESMGWHDVSIRSFFADDQAFALLFDMDYIFQWVPPGRGEQYFRFWVSPVTMVFENVADVKIDIESSLGTIEIADLHRQDPVLSPNGKFTIHRYIFECQEGVISFTATGYRMHVRRAPILGGQRLDLAERGGICFGINE